MSPREKNDSLRQHIAFEAARIMAEEACHDMPTARRKAAERLGCNNHRQLPGQAEIERALREHQRLFHGDRQPATLLRLRRLAAEAMTSMECFRPRLVGPVLTGTADEHSRIQIHLFADTPEQVALFLMEKNIPWQDGERTLRYPGNEKQTHPVYRFRAGETEVELTLFSPKELRRSPLAPLDNRPQQRASLSQLQKLLESTEEG